MRRRRDVPREEGGHRRLRVLQRHRRRTHRAATRATRPSRPSQRGQAPRLAARGARGAPARAARGEQASRQRRADARRSCRPTPRRRTTGRSTSSRWPRTHCAIRCRRSAWRRRRSSIRGRRRRARRAARRDPAPERAHGAPDRRPARRLARRRRRVPPAVQHLELGGILDDAIDGCRHAIDKKRQRLRVELAPGTATVHGDPQRLTQVFSNLLNNASRRSPPGGDILLAMALGADQVGGQGRRPRRRHRAGSAAAHLRPVRARHQRAGRRVGARHRPGGRARARQGARRTVAASSAAKDLGSEFIVRLPRAAQAA